MSRPAVSRGVRRWSSRIVSGALHPDRSPTARIRALPCGRTCETICTGFCPIALRGARPPCRPPPRHWRAVEAIRRRSVIHAGRRPCATRRGCCGTSPTSARPCSSLFARGRRSGRQRVQRRAPAAAQGGVHDHPTTTDPDFERAAPVIAVCALAACSRPRHQLPTWRTGWRQAVGRVVSPPARHPDVDGTLTTPTSRSRALPHRPGRSASPATPTSPVLVRQSASAVSSPSSPNPAAATCRHRPVCEANLASISQTGRHWASIAGRRTNNAAITQSATPTAPEIQQANTGSTSVDTTGRQRHEPHDRAIADQPCPTATYTAINASRVYAPQPLSSPCPSFPFSSIQESTS